MKKVFLMLAISLGLVACSQNKEQVDIAKAKLTEIGVSQNELSKYKFSVNEISEKDMYDLIVEYYKQRANAMSFADAKLIYLEKASSYLEKRAQVEDDKVCYQVRALRIIGDTINDKTFYLNDKDSIVAFINKK